MIYRVNFTSQGTFIKGSSNVRRKKFDKEGNLIEDADYKAPYLPKVGRMYTPHRKDSKILIDMAQKDLNELVKEMEIYDDKGNQILTAPINNPSAPFWIHPKVSVWIENAGTNFDDEDPFGRFFLACMQADPTFRISTEYDNPAMSGITKFTVTKASDAVSEKDRDLDEVALAMELLVAMDFDKQVKILNAMGVNTKNPSPIQAKRVLTEKITTMKDYMLQNGERNIDLFLRLAKTKTSEINIRGLITKALDSDSRLIHKDKRVYYYNETPLGKNLDEVYNFLIDDDNKDILAELAKQVGDGLSN